MSNRFASARDRLRGITASNAAILLTAVGVLITGMLVYRVAWTAEAIHAHAKRIDTVAVSVDEAALAVTKLDTTNRYASSILNSAKPLDAQLSSVAGLAESVDGHATSINDSAGTVRGTAGTIDTTAANISTTATGINSRAADIVSIAQSIMRGVDQINANLDQTISVVTRIKADTANILGQAHKAHTNAACIDAALGTDDGHCKSGG